MTIVALLQARNEERFLPTWLENVAPAVSAIVALDDGSSDRTAEILSGHPKVAELLRKPHGESWNERDNQMSLIKAGRRLGASWFLAVDADERLEEKFVRDLPQLIEDAEARGMEAYSMRLLELWGDRNHYRVDGIWKGKARYRLFRNNSAHTKFDPRPLHRHWLPLEIVTNIAKVGAHLPHRLYHLRMIRAEDRDARHRRYVSMDPSNRYQSQGYDYLVDETGLELAEVPADRDFLPRPDPAAV